jgi:hypothetical protein
LAAFVLWYTGRNQPPTDDLGGPDAGPDGTAGPDANELALGGIEDTQVTPPPAAPPPQGPAPPAS